MQPLVGFGPEIWKGGRKDGDDTVISKLGLEKCKQFPNVMEDVCQFHCRC